MERRHFMTALALAGIAGSAEAASPQQAAGAAPQRGPRPGYKELAESSASCLCAAQACLRRAVAQLAAKDASLADCANSSADVVAACSALSALAATDAAFAMGFARTVADVCLACKKDCDKFAQIPECAALSAACQTCADACGKAAG